MAGYNVKTYEQISLHIEFCYSCGTPIGIHQSAWHNLKKDEGSFWCPMGHKLRASIDQTEKELREKIERLESWNRAERERAQAAERRERAQKAAKTRIKNRVAKGVCPCCKRSFINLRRHMETKHPDYTESSV